MSQRFLPARTMRRLSQQPCRLFSTSRPASRFSASSVGGIASRRATRTVATNVSLHRPSVPRSLPSPCPFRQPHASFSASSVRPGTKVIQNPRTGDDGETLMVSISPRAVEVRSRWFRSSWPFLSCGFIRSYAPAFAGVDGKLHGSRSDRYGAAIRISKSGASPSPRLESVQL